MVQFWCSFGAVLVQFRCGFGAVLVQFWVGGAVLVQIAPLFGATCTSLSKPRQNCTKTAPFFEQKRVFLFKHVTMLIYFGNMSNMLKTYDCFTQMMTFILIWLIFVSYFFQYSLTCIKMVAALHHICITTAPYIYPQHKLLLKSVPNHEQADPKREERPRWFPEGEGITGPKYVRFIGNIVNIVFMNKRGEVTSICHLDSEINNNQMWPSSSDGLHSESP